MPTSCNASVTPVSRWSSSTPERPRVHPEGQLRWSSSDARNETPTFRWSSSERQRAYRDFVSRSLGSYRRPGCEVSIRGSLREQLLDHRDGVAASGTDIRPFTAARGAWAARYAARCARCYSTTEHSWPHGGVQRLNGSVRSVHGSRLGRIHSELDRGSLDSTSAACCRGRSVLRVESASRRQREGSSAKRSRA